MTSKETGPVKERYQRNKCLSRFLDGPFLRLRFVLKEHQQERHHVQGPLKETHPLRKKGCTKSISGLQKSQGPHCPTKPKHRTCHKPARPMKAQRFGALRLASARLSFRRGNVWDQPLSCSVAPILSQKGLAWFSRVTELRPGVKFNPIAGGVKSCFF